MEWIEEARNTSRWMEAECMGAKTKGFVVGLSGGIDSALVACLAVQAVGRANVVGVSMPSNQQSDEDAETLAKNLEIRFLRKPIGAATSAIQDLGGYEGYTDDLVVDSPYNTYKYKGLPPGPIGNPGIDSINAVANPETNNFLYFLTDPEGKVYYAEDFEGHQKNRQLYL